MQRLLDWVDARSGYRAYLHHAQATPLPGGARWARTWGALTLALTGLVALTGLGLSAWYSPSATDAWASVHYIQFQVSLGWLLRGLHHVGGSLLIVVVVVHLLQALVWGSYRAPRELTWVSGVIALQVLIIASHTGYLLPNDLRAYWASQVLLGIAGNQPGVGPLGQTLIQGGPAFGNATITHFYALHVLLLPAALVLMLGAHVWLRRRHAAATPMGVSDAEASARAQPYWPWQGVKDAAVAFATFAALFAYVIATNGVELGAPADPAIQYVARPEWYFYPVFHLRHWFTGSAEFIATSVLPGAATLALAGLPFVHAWLSKRSPKAHQVLVGSVLAGLVATVALGVTTAVDDARDEKAVATNKKADAIAHEAHRLAMLGVPVSGPLELYKNDPLVWGARVWVRDCASCHSDCSASPYKGAPCMEGYGSRTWLTKFFKDPAAPHFFGNTKIDEMDAYDGAALPELVEMLYAESGRPDADAALAAKGLRAYVAEGCESCHTIDGKGNGEAPDLKAWASEAWLRDFIRTPEAERFYGSLNEMDSFSHDKLDKAELEAVIAYLRAQTDKDAKF